MSFPIDRVAEREYDARWEGVVVTCDIDRTYLETRFSSLRGLARIPFEFGVDKRDIVGMARLLKELRRGPGAASRHTPLYFLSASPAQLRRVICRKMLLDGLEHDGTTFKDWRRVLLSRRWSRLREQVGFKVTALTMARAELPAGAREILVGDDLESDALAFCLYADVVAGRLEGDALLRALSKAGVAAEDAAAIAARQQRLGAASGVQRIFIRLERGTPEQLRPFWPWVVPARGALQLAVGLLAEGCVSVEGVAAVAGELLSRGVERGELAEGVADAVSRGLLARDRAAPVAEALEIDVGGLPDAVAPEWAAPPEGGTCWTPAEHR